MKFLFDLLIDLLAVISGNFNRLNFETRTQLETLTHKDKLVISINKTSPEIMKQVVIFMYTAKCDINEGNGKFHFIGVLSSFDFRFSSAYELLDAAGRYDIKDLKVHVGRCKSMRFFCC